MVIQTFYCLNHYLNQGSGVHEMVETGDACKYKKQIQQDAITIVGTHIEL